MEAFSVVPVKGPLLENQKRKKLYSSSTYPITNPTCHYNLFIKSFLTWYLVLIPVFSINCLSACLLFCLYLSLSLTVVLSLCRSGVTTHRPRIRGFILPIPNLNLTHPKLTSKTTPLLLPCFATFTTHEGSPSLFLVPPFCLYNT